VLGVATSCLALVGWASHSLLLAGFGFARYPEWPSNALALISLGFGALAIQFGHKAAGQALLGPPLLVGLITLGAYLLGTASPLDGWLVPAAGGAADIADRGRPSVFAAISLLLLSAGVLMADKSDDRLRIAAEVSAAAALGLNSLSLCVDLLQLEITAQTVRLPASVPASCAAGLLALVVMRWRSGAGSPRHILQSAADRTFAALLLLAVIPSLILPIIEGAGRRATMSTLEIVLVASSLYLVLALTVWGWIAANSRRDRQALEDLVGAFNTVPVVLVRPDGRIATWSEGCAILFDLPAANAVGRELAAVLPGFPDALWSEGGAGYATPSPMRRLETQDSAGRPLTLLARAEPIETSAGRLLAIALSDTGTLAETRAALHRSETALEMALDGHQIAVFDWDVASGRLTWSSGAEERLGLEPGEMTDYATWRSLVHPDDAETVLAVIAKTVENRAPRFNFRYRLTGRQGQVRTVEGAGHCIYGPDGAMARCVGFNIDVTERDRREMALVTSEAQLRAIIETVPDAMIVIDEQGKMQSLSAAAERLFGVDAAASIGQNVAMLMPEPWAGEHDRYLADYFQTGERKVIGRRRELFAKRSDGSEMPIELNVGEAWVGDRRLFVGFVRDISQRVEAERRLEELNSAYAHSARLNAVGELAASLAHELNQPLAASSNFLAAAEALLQRDEGQSPITDFLAQAGQQILRAGEIIRRLRDFIAKTDAEMQILPLAPVLREAVELGLTGNRQLRIDILFDLDPTVSSFLGDRIQIEQVIVNLVRNAAQVLSATPPGERSILIKTLRQDADMVRVSVVDSGPGVPAIVLHQLAESFLTTKGEGGLGLGISICRRIVEAHGGVLTARNEKPNGARFEFTLPVGDEDAHGEES
jgi:two-component system sensor kinase FixL